MGIISSVSPGTLFFTGIGVGIGASLAIGAWDAGHKDDDEGRRGAQVMLATALSGAVLVGVGLLGAMSLEHVDGPYRTRYMVDAAEEISHRVINLDWASRSGRYGAILAGAGGALMMSSAGMF